MKKLLSIAVSLKTFVVTHFSKLLLCLFAIILRTYAIEVDKKNKKPQIVEEFAILELRKEIDSIRYQQAKIGDAINNINTKIDVVDRKLKNTTTNITNITKNEIHEKAELTKANDSINRNYFTSYINDWLRTNNKK